MDEQYDLRSRLQVAGVFWDTASPDDKFSGTLGSDGKHLELATSAELVKPHMSFMNLNVAPVPDIVHGFTTQGSCTLIGFHEIGSPGLMDFPNDRGIRFRKFRVTGACLMGWHLPSETANVLTSADFTYSGIGEWLPGSGGVNFGQEAVTFSYPTRLPTALDVCVLANRVRVVIKINPNFQLRSGGRQHSSLSEPVLTVEPTEPKSLQWFIDMGHRFENLFSLCLGVSIRAKAVHLNGPSEESGWLIRPRGGKAEKPYLPIWVRGDSSQLAKAIAAWFSTPEEFIPLENLIYGTIRHSSLFVETEFLSLAQAVESLHRLTDRSTVVEPRLFKQILKSLCRFIPATCGDSPIVNRLLDGIRYANEPTFQSRIASLLARINPDRIAKLIGDPVFFEKTLRQTRNYFTHPGIRKQENVLTDPKEIFLFNQKLHVLLRLLMLKSVGFSEEDVFECIFQQSRRWA